jgi:hypothetical protein
MKNLKPFLMSDDGLIMGSCAIEKCGYGKELMCLIDVSLMMIYVKKLNNYT